MRKFLYIIFLSIIIGILYIYFKPDLRVKFIEQLDGKSFTYLKNNKIIHSFKTKKIIKKFSHTPNNINDTTKLKNIELFYGNEKLSLKKTLYQKGQRYYIPIKDFCDSVNGVYNSVDNNKYTIQFNNILYTISKDTKTISSPNGAVSLRGEPLVINDTDYLSVSDIEEIFTFISFWDTHNNKISFSPINRNKLKSLKKDGTIALTRLEDISAGEDYNEGNNLLKLKIVAENLSKNNMNFSIAWVPRYKDPENKVDVNLLTDFSMNNAAFINTLDYIINIGGVIGLHGYTHQHDNEKSITSTELTKDFNTTEEDVVNIATSAINVADSLNIPYSFFETPHYGATEFQQSILEKYFDYIYEPYVGIYNSLPLVSPRNNHTIYVPAPLSYVKGNDAQELIDKIKNNKSSTLTSFFYHPYKEFDFITVNTSSDGHINYSYSSDSPLNQIGKALNDNGYVTIKITDIK